MALAPGTQLGPYQISSQLGAGGMGEVYRATDTRLDRTVAIKVLPEHLASDPSRRERFEREAKAVSSLNHPHICTLYDVGEQDGIHYLVMELVEGQTLESRLAKGRLPLDQALEYAIQIADALDKAHRQGVVHRDLKPGNIMLTKSGVKLLDFGLAKLRGDSAPTSGLSQAPTQEKSLTAEGTIIGTLQYMAPEQLEGEEADARTDIFAFGAVVYEMVTGKKAFEGKSQASLIGAIMNSEPQPMSELEAMTPRSLDHLVRTCLAKDPEGRWQTTLDLVREIKWIAETRSNTEVVAQPSSRGVPVGWASTLVLVTLVAGLAIVLSFRSNPSGPEMRLEITTPPSRQPGDLAISPDGEFLAFVADSGDRSLLWVRSLGTGTSRPLGGTEGASSPFWSPDSQSLGFRAEGRLKRIDLDQGLVRDLADAGLPQGGGTWNDAGDILYPSVPSQGIRHVPAGGSQFTIVTQTQTEALEASHSYPQFLPDGRRFIYFVIGSPEVAGIYVGELGQAESQRLLEADSQGVYVSSGHLLFVRQETLLVQEFDPQRLELSGEPVPLADGVTAFSASDAGPIVFRTGSRSVNTSLVWFDRFGEIVETVGEEFGTSPSLSPDGSQVAVHRGGSRGGADIWLVDLDRALSDRFTFDAANEIHPIWSPLGDRLAFSSNRNDRYDLYVKATTSAGTEDLLVENAVRSDWSPDGRVLLYETLSGPQRDIWALYFEDEQESFPVLQTDFNERAAQFSPDGTWIAYQSNESGRFEIYIQRFPGPGNRTRISTEGGVHARWRDDGSELFYVALDGQLMAVPIQISSNEVRVTGDAVRLFLTRFTSGVQGVDPQQYVVSPDGQRFLMNTLIQEATTPINVILNWNPEGTE